MTPLLGPTNDELAAVLVQMADLLARLGEPNPYRVQAYLHGAEAVRAAEEPLALLYARGGRKALLALPAIGDNLAAHLADYLERGRVGLADRLMAAAHPEALLASVPGVSPALAARLVAAGIGTLAELERAAYDGRLAALDGIGPRRLEAIRLQLNTVLHRAARRRLRRVRRQVARLAAASVPPAHLRPVARPEAPEPPRPTPPAVIHVLHGPAAAA